MVGWMNGCAGLVRCGVVWRGVVVLRLHACWACSVSRPAFVWACFDYDIPGAWFAGGWGVGFV